MISTAFDLAAALLLLAGESFALLLMILGGIDLYDHFQERKRAKN